MKKPLFYLFFVILMLALIVPVTVAQDAPTEVREAAIRAVQEITGRTDRPSSWTWVLEPTVNTTDLNCILTESAPLGRNVNVYVMKLNFSGVEYEVRVSQDATIVQPCDAKLINSDDIDGDGLPNDLDACPNQGAGIFGLGPGGCPVNDPVTACNLTAEADCNDPDSDGVPNHFDGCPQEFGTLANMGCPTGTTANDADNDGVLDSVDSCPNDYGEAANNGCPQGSLPPASAEPLPTAAPVATTAPPVVCNVNITAEIGVSTGPGAEYPASASAPLVANTQWPATGISTNDVWLQAIKDGQEVWLPANSGYRLALGKVAVQATVYDGPATTNNPIAMLEPGTLVNLTSASPDGLWHAIQVNQVAGWMQVEAINRVPAIQVAIQVTPMTGPGADYPVANLLPANAGEVFELTGVTNSWYQLAINGAEGWVPASYALPLQDDCANLPITGGTGGGGVVESTADPTPASGTGPCFVATKQEPQLYTGPNLSQPSATVPQINMPVVYRGLLLINNGEWYGVFDPTYGVQYVYRDDVLRTAGNCTGLPAAQDTTFTTMLSSLNNDLCILLPTTLTANVRAQPTAESTRLAEIPSNQTLMALAKWDVWYLTTRGWVADWVVAPERPCSALATPEQISMEPDPAFAATVSPGTASPATTSTTGSPSQPLTRYACPPDFAGYMQPRITLGTGTARLTPGGIPNKLRETPAVTGAQVGTVQPGRTFNQVIDGPACSDGYVWWYVEIDGTFGWTAESSFYTQEYWLEPVE